MGFTEFSAAIERLCGIPSAIAAIAEFRPPPAGLAEKVAAASLPMGRGLAEFDADLIDALEGRGPVRFRGRTAKTWHHAAIAYLAEFQATVRAAVIVGRMKAGDEFGPDQELSVAAISTAWELILAGLGDFTDQDSDDIVGAIQWERSMYERKHGAQETGEKPAHQDGPKADGPGLWMAPGRRPTLFSKRTRSPCRALSPFRANSGASLS